MQRNLFVFLGRRGAVSRWIMDIAALAPPGAAFVVSRQNEIYERIRGSGADVVGVDTFRDARDAILFLPRIFAARRAISEVIESRRIDRVIVLMSHVWTPLLANSVRKSGAEYVVVVHDAAPHPGDATGRLHRWLMRDALKADKVITLSGYVSDQLIRSYPAVRGRVETLFPPALGVHNDPCEPRAAGELRFLYFGRILPYKGLALFVEACEMLHRERLPFHVSVVGEGELGGLGPRLERIGAGISNHWLDDSKVPATVGAHDVIVVPSVEASQSGVAAVSFAAGKPVLATPVGGLPEQIAHDRTGLIAQAVSAEAIASEMRRLVLDRDLYARLVEGVRQDRAVSIERFLKALDGL